MDIPHEQPTSSSLDTMPSTPTESAREMLNRPRIVHAAVELADAHGVESITMRALAKHLGFEVMSLYHYVKNKADLVEAMGEYVAAQVPLPPVAEDEWKAAIRQHALDVRTALERHRWAAMVWATSPPGHERIALSEWLLRTISYAKLDHRSADHLFHAITDHGVGYALQANVIESDEQRMDYLNRMAEAIDAETFPFVTAHFQSHMNGEQVPSFEFVLDILLDAFEK